MSLNLALSCGVTSAALGFSLDFTTGSLPAGVTLTRASAGTRINASGTLASATNDVARFDYSPTSVGTLLGLLIEPAATNVLLHSEQLDDATWTKQSGVTVTADQAVAPDGATTADKVTGDGAAGVFFAPGGNSAPGSPAALSIWLKGVSGGEVVKINEPNNGGSDILTCNLTTAWQRFTCQTNNPTIASVGLWVRNVPAGGIFAWGAQVECAASVATSYIPATTGSVSRAADSLSFTIPAGISTLRYTFDDLSTQTVSVSPGAYTVPTNLNRSRIRTIAGS